jgi:hypothetical protein
LQSSPQSTCLFIDGLDEIDQEEQPFNLIELIRGISAQANTKICLASRPEHVYLNEYSKFPKMMLQDLTELDIYNYAKKELERYGFSFQPDPEKRIEEFVELIMWKAEGVFLCVHLVLKSLRTGIQSRSDDWLKLKERLERTPSELSELYQQMWERLGDDVALYQQEASFYFNLVFDHDDFINPTPSVCELAFANSTHPQDVIRDGRPNSLSQGTKFRMSKMSTTD